MKQTEYVYDGVEHNPKPIIAIDNKTLKINVDYELSYTNTRDCGCRNGDKYYRQGKFCRKG